uniref:Lcl domain-containing protein n=1 Tax=Algoriphagus sp. TaxID=1872435 RepID=UPI0040473774
GKGGGSINNNTAFGNSSLGINSTGSVNTAAGFESLKSNTSGEANTAFGAYALRENQNGARNTAVGSQALQLTNGAYDNTAIGALSAVSNTTGNNNVAIGSKSLQSNTAGRDNIAVGFEALYLNQANGNTASGYQSMRQNIGGGRNTALGYTALYSNTTASFNVAVGAQALGGTTTGERNVAIGAGALDENRTGSYNTVLGGFAGRYIANGSSSALDGGSDGASPNTIMDNSILIGAWTKPKANNETNQIVIGYNAIGNGSNTIQLGNTGITNVKTSGTLTAGAVTYPNVDGSANQVLSTNGSGTLAWSTSNGLPTTGNTAGDMLYWNGSTNAWVKVAAGTDGQTLTFIGGKPVWSNHPFPDAPTIGTATAGNGQASVPFTAPASDGGSAITSYTATSNPGNITGTISQAGSGTITVTGLTNGTAYTFTVTATNSVGTSAASAASNSVTPALKIGDPYQGGKIFWLDGTGQHGLIAAPNDQSAKGIGWSAAQLCNDLVLGDYSDWYLPSKDELNKLYLNRTVVGGFVTIGNSSHYWSSTEKSAGNSNAWNQHFSDGAQHDHSKNSTFYVRAVRAF